MSKLSVRQNEIADLTADGFLPDAIGAKLGIAGSAVRMQISRILKKKGLSSALELSAYVWRKRSKIKVTPATNQQHTS